MGTVDPFSFVFVGIPGAEWAMQVPVTPMAWGGATSNNVEGNSSRAYPIKDPKTGEVVRDAMQKEAARKTKIARAKRVLLNCEGESPADYLVLAAMKGWPAAKAASSSMTLAKRGGVRWCADRSTFSALSLEAYGKNSLDDAPRKQKVLKRKVPCGGQVAGAVACQGDLSGPMRGKTAAPGNWQHGDLSHSNRVQTTAPGRWQQECGMSVCSRGRTTAPGHWQHDVDVSLSSRGPTTAPGHWQREGDFCQMISPQTAATIAALSLEPGMGGMAPAPGTWAQPLQEDRIVDAILEWANSPRQCEHKVAAGAPECAGPGAHEPPAAGSTGGEDGFVPQDGGVEGGAATPGGGADAVTPCEEGSASLCSSLPSETAASNADTAETDAVEAPAEETPVAKGDGLVKDDASPRRPWRTSAESSSVSEISSLRGSASEEAGCTPTTPDTASRTPTASDDGVVRRPWKPRFLQEEEAASKAPPRASKQKRSGVARQPARMKAAQPAAAKEAQPAAESEPEQPKEDPEPATEKEAAAEEEKAQFAQKDPAPVKENVQDQVGENGTNVADMKEASPSKRNDVEAKEADSEAGREKKEKLAQGDASPPDRSLFGSRNLQGFGRRQKDALPERSENAYVVKRNADAERDLDRQVLSTLNKMCPENVRSLAERIKELDVRSIEDLERVIAQIFKKALIDSHYSDTYADLVYYLKAEMPEFPNPEGGKPVSFKSVLLTSCQNEYTGMPKNLDNVVEDEGKDLEDVEFARLKRKQRILSNITFIGHLFLRNLLRPQIIGFIMQDLTGSDDADTPPEEHLLECLLKLILTIGFTLDNMEVGKKSITQVFGRLMELKRIKDKKTGKEVYQKRVQFAIQDLLDIRKAGWEKTTFKVAAKTMDEIRQDQAKGHEYGAGDRVTVGLRPAYLHQDGTPKSCGARADLAAAAAAEGWVEAKRRPPRR